MSEKQLPFSDEGAPHVLVVRTDRLGDVILTTPVFERIHNHYPHARITALVQTGVAPLLRGLPSVHDLIPYDPLGRHEGFRGWFRLWRALRRRRFRFAVVAQGSFRVGLAVWLAGIRYRVGPWSKPYSYLFYNRGLRQRRSQVEMHEADYNLQLLRRLGIRTTGRMVAPSVHLASGVREEAGAWLRSRGWNGQDRIVVVHPGMGGSALNWPEDHYLSLVAALAKELGTRVLLTGGAAERDLVERVRLKASHESILSYVADGGQGIEFLAGLYAHAALVVAPSTGPLHLASALGVRVVSFFPPIRVQSAIRWGPYVKDETRVTVFAPEVYCGEDFRCRGSLCNYFPCMKTILVPQVLEEARRHLTALQSDRKEASP